MAFQTVFGSEFWDEFFETSLVGSFDKDQSENERACSTKFQIHSFWLILNLRHID